MRLSTIAMVAMLSVGFSSCKGDDEDGPKAEKTDYGRDGLKGYWLGDESNPLFFYLDGEGGGTFYCSNAGHDPCLRFSTTYHGTDYTWTYTRLYKTVKDTAGNTYTLYGEEAYTSPLVYALTGSTLTIIRGGEGVSTYNVANGSLVGYKRVTIVN